MDSNQIFEEVDDFKVARSFECFPSDCVAIIGNSRAYLKVITQNIRSIYKNLDSLVVLQSILNFECDILILTESRLSEDKLLPQLPSYNVHSTTKYINQNDGVVVYCKSNISYSIEEPVFVDASCLIIRIPPHTAIIAIYRPPCFRTIDKFLDSLEAVLGSLSSSTNIIIMGDINLDIKNGNNDSMSTDYLNLTAEHGLLPANNFPTRYGNCLDHVLLKTKSQALSFVLQNALTDHFPVLLCLSSKAAGATSRKTVFKSVDYKNIAKLLKESDIANILLMNDANTAADSLINILMNSIQLSTILRPIPSRRRISKPWITQGLLRCIRHRDNMHLKVKKQPNDQILVKSYRRYRNFCNGLLKKLKVSYERSELEKASQSTKQTWKVIKSITNITRNKSPPMELLESRPNPQTAINYTNEYFANVGKSLASEIANIEKSSDTSCDIKIQTHPRSFVLLSTDIREVEQTILALKSDCAPGWDGISASLLKSCKDIIVPPLTHIINTCFESGTFPNAFKKSIIHPIYKNGPRDSVNNYRPISILPSLSKIVEKLINKRLTHYLEHEKILSESQFGFRSGKSTLQAVSCLTDYVVSNLDHGKKCIGIFLDMAKAFDTVSIPLLLAKLERLGIRGSSLRLFESYLSNRMQAVTINDLVSTDAYITYGVPQGSILGPSLFLIFINELCQFVPDRGKIFTFADDTALIFEGESWEATRMYAECGMQRVIIWLQKNLLSLNLSKTKYLPFSILKKGIPQKDTFQIHAHTCRDYPKRLCNCMCLEQVLCIKYLGVMIDSQLSWMPQIVSVASRVRKLIWVFKNLRNVATGDLLKSVYYALCQSVIGYCIPVWGGACKTYLIKLERAQRSVLKVMNFKSYRYSTELLYKECKVLTVRQLFILYLVTVFHKSVPFNPHLSSNIRRTSNRVCSVVPCNTKFANRHSYFLGAYIYNKLNKILLYYPMTVFKCKSIVKNWIIDLNYSETEKLLEILS